MIRINSLVFSCLCNRLTGTLILNWFGKSIPDIRWKKFRFSVDKKLVNKRLIASIFWGFYESAEIRFIEKYLDGNLDVLELGGSIGIVSSHIGARLEQGRKLVIVEANPNLIASISTNAGRHCNEGVVPQVLNCAIGYDSDKVQLNLTNNNTETRIVREPSSSSASVEVPARTVNSILKEYGMTTYTLVSDIEGSEVEIFLKESDSLGQCKQLFIELHDTSNKGKPYTINEIEQLIQNIHGFSLVARQGAVFYFNRP